MKLGIWNHPAVEFLISGLAGSGEVFDAVEIDPATALQSLRRRDVDIALVPTLSVIREPDGVEVLPAVAFSTWNYPFAILVLEAGLDSPPQTVNYPRRASQEADIARIVLSEHYRMEPSFQEEDSGGRSPGSPLQADLIVSRELVAPAPGTRLDLGQEWYELANYPMVWGVFVMRKGEANAGIVQGLREMAERSEKLRQHWSESKDHSEALRVFFADDMRLRFDDLAVASITELLSYAFYYDIVDEIRAFPIAEVEMDDGDSSPKIEI